MPHWHITHGLIDSDGDQMDIFRGFARNREDALTEFERCRGLIAKDGVVEGDPDTGCTLSYPSGTLAARFRMEPCEEGCKEVPYPPKIPLRSLAGARKIDEETASPLVQVGGEGDRVTARFSGSHDVMEENRAWTL